MLTFFAKYSISDVWQGSGYACASSLIGSSQLIFQQIRELKFMQNILDLNFLKRKIEARRCSIKKIFLNFFKIHRKAPVPESLYQLSCSLLEVFGTGAFLRILRNFKNIFFYRIFPWLILRRNIILPKPQQSLAALLKPSRHKQTISRSLDMCFFIDVSSSPLSISARPMEPLPAEWEKLIRVKCKNSQSLP